MDSTFERKVDLIKTKFASFISPDEKYGALIEMGRSLPTFEAQYKTPDRIVRGCQSTLYLRSFLIEGKMFFEAASDALISAGLAALLIYVYSGESPETILKRPPDFLAEIGIMATLSMNRSNGLAHIHLRMKQDAISSLIVKEIL